MNQHTRISSFLAMMALSMSLVMLGGIDTALADRYKYRDHDYGDRYNYSHDNKHYKKHYKHKDYSRHYDSYRHHDYKHKYKHKYKHRHHPNKHRTHHYRETYVYRPYDSDFDDDAYKWLSYTAITLKILDVLDNDYRR